MKKIMLAATMLSIGAMRLNAQEMAISAEEIKANYPLGAILDLNSGENTRVATSVVLLYETYIKQEANVNPGEIKRTSGEKFGIPELGNVNIAAGNNLLNYADGEAIREEKETIFSNPDAKNPKGSGRGSGYSLSNGVNFSHRIRSAVKRDLASITKPFGKNKGQSCPNF